MGLMMDLDTKTKADVIFWLRSFSDMVRTNDYSNAEKMFDTDTFGFGTIASSYSGLKEYRSLQWQECWVGSKDFEFEYSTLKVVIKNKIIVIGIMWKSTGIRPDGKEFPRDGRATIVFRKNDDGSLVSIHNHYSRTPKDFPQDF